MAVSPTQKFSPVQDIQDGVVVLKDGALRSILLASSMNFALKSADEQTAILLQFQNFLNSLDFSLQIFIQSRRLDINPYLNILKKRLSQQTTELIKIQTREYIDFIRNFTDTVNIMSKSFFIVIPYTATTGDDKKSSFVKMFKRSKKDKNKSTERITESKIQLDQRAVLVEQGLRACGIRTARLGTEELIELFYKTFNPGDLGHPLSQDLKDNPTEK